MQYKNGFLICGKDLVYTEDKHQKKCFYCGKNFQSNESCTDKHFVCDQCHSSDAMDLIETYSINTSLTDPVEIAINLMKNSQIKMHGPEHHFLVPAVLAASYYNSTNEPGKKTSAIKIARKRGEKVPGGFCGFHGACGAGIGNGIFVSILTEATPVTEQNWSQSNLATAKALESIAHCGGPRCCKRDTFLALLSAQNFVKDTFDIDIRIKSEIKCTFSDLNKECLESNCQFF